MTKLYNVCKGLLVALIFCHCFVFIHRKFLSFKSKSSLKHDNSGYEACSSENYAVPTFEACVPTSSAATNTPTASAANSGEQQASMNKFLKNFNIA